MTVTRVLDKGVHAGCGPDLSGETAKTISQKTKANNYSVVPARAFGNKAAPLGNSLLLASSGATAWKAKRGQKAQEGQLVSRELKKDETIQGIRLPKGARVIMDVDTGKLRTVRIIEALHAKLRIGTNEFPAGCMIWFFKDGKPSAVSLDISKAPTKFQNVEFLETGSVTMELYKSGQIRSVAPLGNMRIKTNGLTFKAAGRTYGSFVHIEYNEDGEMISAETTWKEGGFEGFWFDNTEIKPRIKKIKLPGGIVNHSCESEKRVIFEDGEMSELIEIGPNLLEPKAETILLKTEKDS